MPRLQVILLVSFMLLTLLPRPGIGEINQNLSAEELTVLQAAEITVQLGRQYQDSIWPGYDLDRRPLFVYIPDTWAILFNAPPSATGFTTPPESWPNLQTDLLYHAGKYDELVGQLAFDMPIDSLQVAAVGFIDQGLYDFLAYLLHENFHQYQHAHFGEIPWEREERYPIEDADNSSLAGLEVILLQQALESLGHADDALAFDKIRQFVGVRLYRWQNIPSNVRMYELGLEINEGTAKYVEMKALSLVPRVRYESHLNYTDQLASVEPTSLDMRLSLIDNLQRIFADGAIAPENMPRNRVYPVGATEGVLLDYLGIDWKPIAQLAGPQFTFAGLLGDALGVDSTDIDSLVAVARNQNQYASIRKLSEKSIAEYRTGFDSALAIFESQSGFRVTAKLSGRNLRRSSYSHAKRWLADNGTRQLRGHNQVYELRSIPGDDLTIQLTETGMMELNDWSTRDKTVIFYSPEITSCEIDGKPMRLTGSVKRQFDSLHLKGPVFEITANRPGMISADNGEILIDWLDPS
ncbi:MAG: hypothetical protein JW763_09960 [candidate division Zixibacteria bacterium]|nr:hypothetical protein [candidate division Zixibacteria bacterium]